MSVKSYFNFDLLLHDLGDGYQVRVIDSPAGQASRHFSLPFSALELENFILKIGQNRGNVRSLHIETIDVPSVKKLGGALYECIFAGEVAERFRSSLAIAKHQNKGLRIRLRLSGAPKLIDIPWELLFDAANNNYIGLSVNTPIIRKLDLASLPDMRPVEGILRVLVMISSPSGYYPLDVEREWERINTATQDLQDEGRLSLTRIEPSLAVLQRQLRREEFHVFHYIGHGGFDRQNNEGVLVLEDQQRKGHLVSGQYLGTILYDHATIQLALLNSCSGGRTSVTDPFAGVGQNLLQKGIPAVIAMQFEITDEAAITFSHEFYAALADGYPIDAAVAEARKMIYAQANQLEWATPVLYTSIDSGKLLSGAIVGKETSRKDKPQSGETRAIIETLPPVAATKAPEEPEITLTLVPETAEIVDVSEPSIVVGFVDKSEASSIVPTVPDEAVAQPEITIQDQQEETIPQPVRMVLSEPLPASPNRFNPKIIGLVLLLLLSVVAVIVFQQFNKAPESIQKVAATPEPLAMPVNTVAPQPEIPKRYQLSIKAMPENAAITVDGKTYEPGKEWGAGTYTVKAVAEGYKAAEKAVTIRDQNENLVMELEKIRYALTVKTNPADARISLLGNSLSYEPGILLPPGDYEVKVEANGYQSQEKTISIMSSDEILNVELTLEQLFIEPEMVNIPSGKFTMGCKDGRDDVEGGCSDYLKPVQEVSIHSFQMATKEVTFDQWDICEKAKICPHADDRGWGRGSRPVIKVSWNDVQVFIKWLNKKTGKNYRLPTESEWEYAARGGKNTAFPWGNTVGENNANCDGCGGRSSKQTVAVGSFAANGYGLFDTSGNVWEWVEDCWGDDLKDLPENGRVRDNCKKGEDRVIRGGSWKGNGKHIRSVFRFHDVPNIRLDALGFRLALDHS